MGVRFARLVGDANQEVWAANAPYPTHGCDLLREITTNGMGIDTSHREEMVQSLETVREEHRIALRQIRLLARPEGFRIRALQEILRQLDRQYPDVYFPKTENGPRH